MRCFVRIQLLSRSQERCFNESCTSLLSFTFMVWHVSVRFILYLSKHVWVLEWWCLYILDSFCIISCFHWWFRQFVTDDVRNVWLIRCWLPQSIQSYSMVYFSIWRMSLDPFCSIPNPNYSPFWLQSYASGHGLSSDDKSWTQNNLKQNSSTQLSGLLSSSEFRTSTKPSKWAITKILSLVTQCTTVAKPGLLTDWVTEDIGWIHSRSFTTAEFHSLRRNRFESFLSTRSDKSNRTGWFAHRHKLDR
jgi:hypothetical protein